MSLFKDIKGQKRITGVLSSHLRQNNLSHSYLFVGNDGCGKEFIARHFAKYILCGNIKNDECINCQKFDNLVHPDFFYIDGSYGIKIEQIRSVIEKINLTPSLSRKKVLLITKGENMGIEAANALLKTLEEPPSDSVILITVRSEKVIPETIVSRSQVLKLNLLTKTQIKRILEEYSPQIDVDDYIRLSAGSIGESFKLIEDKAYFEKKNKTFLDAIFLLSDKNVSEKFKILEEYDKKKEIKDLFYTYVNILHDSIRSEPQFGNNIFKDDFTLKRRKKIADKILKIYSNLDYNVSLRIALEEIILEDKLNVENSRG